MPLTKNPHLRTTLQAKPIVFGGLFFYGGRRTSDKETSKVLRLPSENDIEKTMVFDGERRGFENDMPQPLRLVTKNNIG